MGFHGPSPPRGPDRNYARLIIKSSILRSAPRSYLALKSLRSFWLSCLLVHPPLFGVRVALPLPCFPSILYPIGILLRSLPLDGPLLRLRRLACLPGLSGSSLLRHSLGLLLLSSLPFLSPHHSAVFCCSSTLAPPDPFNAPDIASFPWLTGASIWRQ
jgi:hypothetical protein